MTKLRISVTKEVLTRSAMCGHSGQGEEQIGQNCAIALAVRDIFPKAYVSSDTISPFGDLNFFSPDRIGLSTEAQLFIETFDVMMPDKRVLMDPVEFEVEIPDSVIEQINISEVQNILQNHPTLKLQEG